MRTMNVYLIKASAGSAYSEYKKMTGGPPQNIFATAACTPAGVGIKMADETIGMKADVHFSADIVAIFMSTPDAYRAYELADKFRKKGSLVVLAGLHTNFMQDEALEHADCIMLGETEGIWEDLINDYLHNKVKKIYQRKTPLDLAELKPYPLDLIPISAYNDVWSVVVSRGCPNRCAFCLVHRFSKEFRLRPIEHVVEEIRDCPASWIELHSDNLTADREYALALFKALAPLKKNFFAETTILMAKDDELLDAARNAGIKVLMFGIETISKEALAKQGKGFVQPEEIKKLVHHTQSYGIRVISDFLFGFDEHDKNVFDDTLEFIRDIGFDEIYPHLVIPFPGSAFYAKMEKEGRLKSKDWSKYGGSHAVFKPKQMTSSELENKTYDFWKKSEHLTKTAKGKNLIPSHSLYNGIYIFISIALIATALFIDSNLIWGILFLYWFIEGFICKRTFVLSTIEKNQNPEAYWVSMLLWLAACIYFLSTHLLWGI